MVDRTITEPSRQIKVCRETEVLVVGEVPLVWRPLLQPHETEPTPP